MLKEKNQELKHRIKELEIALESKSKSGRKPLPGRDSEDRMLMRTIYDNHGHKISSIQQGENGTFLNTTYDSDVFDRHKNAQRTSGPSTKRNSISDELIQVDYGHSQAGGDDSREQQDLRN